MADINQIITLGIGGGGDIPHFILVGLSIDVPQPFVAVVLFTGRVVIEPVQAAAVSVEPVVGGAAVVAPVLSFTVEIE